MSFAVAHPVIAGAIVGGASGGISSYQQTGSVNPTSIVLGALQGGLSGGTLGLSGPAAAKMGAGLFLLKASAAVSLGAQVASAAGQRDASRTMGYISMGLAGVYTTWNVGIGVRDWLAAKGTLHDVANGGAVLTDAEAIARYGKEGASIHINGIGQGLEESLGDAAGTNLLFHNPPSGFIADFTESTLEFLTGTSSLSRQLGRLSTQLRLDMVGYSQGALIASNALLYAGFNGGAAVGTTVSSVGGAVGALRLGISASLANATVIYSNTRFLDPIKLVSSGLFPPGYVIGAVGAVTGGRQHFGYFK